jgi:hypothetical protein
MTKTTDRPQPPREETKPAQADLQAAYEIHTLAQMLYGQMTMTRPWVAPPTHGPMPTRSIDTPGQYTTHWTQNWPGAWNPTWPWT